MDWLTDIRTIVGLVIGIIGIAMGYHWGKKGFGASNYPELRLAAAFQFWAGHGTYISCEIMNLSPNITITDLEVKIIICIQRHWWNFIIRKSFIYDLARFSILKPQDNMQFSTKKHRNLEEFISDNFSHMKRVGDKNTLQENKYPKYELLRNDPLEISLQATYKPAITGTKRVTTTEIWKLTPHNDVRIKESNILGHWTTRDAQGEKSSLTVR